MACALPVVAAAAIGRDQPGARRQDRARWSNPARSTSSPPRCAPTPPIPRLRAKHGAAGLAFAKTMDWDAINAAVMKVYARVIERRRRAKAMGVSL